MVFRTDQRNHPRQLQIPKCVISHRSGRFGGDAFIPEVGINPITNFDFIDPINVLMVEAAITKERAAVARFGFIRTKNDREQRTFIRALPAEKFLNERGGLFPTVNAEREPHEIHVCHQSSHWIEIFRRERSER